MEPSADKKFPHDYVSHMLSATQTLQAEYARIRNYKDDAGTAGDEGESNWADLLRDWLPPQYHVVTKGRILNAKGVPSPQVDIIVLKPWYPTALRTKKMYFSVGVAAAFECKLTLKKEHLVQLQANAAEIRRLLPSQTGTLYRDLCSPLIYGLLSHSHVWKSSKTEVAGHIEDGLREGMQKYVRHPKELADFVCVADFSFFGMSKQADDCMDGIHTSYMSFISSIVSPLQMTVLTDQGPAQPFVTDQPFVPVGDCFRYLFLRLAWEDPTLREWYSYLAEASDDRDTQGRTYTWNIEALSVETRQAIANGAVKSVRKLFDEFCGYYPW